ncbi:hypothetical protein, partial [Haloferax profundi]|uniref:hypothetical protein n=1 Tax=Haloferax profundi TaxID=1544718 RepID=UPI000A78D8DF
QITNDRYADYNPVVAGNETSALTAFTSFTKTFNESIVSGPSDLFAHGEVRIATHNTSQTGWSEPTTITNNDVLDFQPTVAHTNGTTLIAWEQDVDGNISTWEDRRVQYVTYDGQLGDVHTIETARTPVVSATNETFTLAVLKMNTTATDGVIETREIETTGAVRTTRSAAVSHMAALDSTNGTVAWIDGAAATPLHLDNGSVVSTVPLSAN